jgi:hypothetical protein
VATTAHTVTARLRRWCDDYICREPIEPGEDYARHVAFPGDECNGGSRPFVLCICQGCQTQYGQPMPPRRSHRADTTRPAGEE